MSISFEGYREAVTTFLADETVERGKLVYIGLDNKLTAAENSGKFIGVCLSVRNGYAAVQTTGYISIPYSGSNPTPGYCKLSADDKGGVKMDVTSGREYLVFEVDTTSKKVGFML